MNTELNPPAHGIRRAVLCAAAALALVVALYISWAAWRAHRNLATLDVRDMEVRQVVKKIEAQTWEDIFVHKDVQGKVTLKVRKMPLEQVLRLVADQTFSRSSLIYPLYSSHESLLALRKCLRGEVDPATHGWTNLQNRAFVGGPGGPGGPFGGGMFGRGMPGQTTPQPQNQLVSLNLPGKDVAFATLALNRFAQARVVPEDGTTATVNLIIRQATASKAVAQLAKAADRKWGKVYALQGGFGGPRGPGGGFGGPGGIAGGPPGFGGRDGNGPPQRGFGGPQMTDEQREEFRKQRETLEAELKAALPADEQNKLEQAQQEREKQMQEFANMTDDQRRDRMMQMGGGNMDKMNRDRILNSTPEQRAQMNQRMNQMRAGGGGPGGPPR